MLCINFIKIELDDDIATFVFSNRLRLSFTILFKLSFKSMSDHSFFSESIIANKTFSLFITKSFFVLMTILIEFMLSRVIDKVFIKFFLKFSAELTICYDFFHFIFDEIKDFFEIFRDRSCVMIAHFKK